MKTLPFQTIYFLLLEGKRVDLVKYIKHNTQDITFSESAEIVEKHWPHGTTANVKMAKALCCHFLINEREKLSENIEMINDEIRKIKNL